MSTHVLVVGATGDQGGAVVDGLLEAGDDRFTVSGLTRDATSEAARALADRGVTVVEGDLADRLSLRAAVEGVDAVFAVTDYWTAGFDGEIEQGSRVARVAAESDVDHFVYSSILGAGRTRRVEQFVSKRCVERHVERLDLPATVLRPAYFMHNLDGMRADIEDGRLPVPLHEGATLQLLDVADYGAVVADVVACPGEFAGETVHVAGDEATLREIAETVTDVLGTDVRPVHVPVEAARRRQPEPLVDAYEWVNSSACVADIEGLETRFGTEFNTLRAWLRKRECDPGRAPSQSR